MKNENIDEQKSKSTSYENEDLYISEYENYLNKRVVVMCKENRFYYGELKNYDQYRSLTLNCAVEKFFYNEQYAERLHDLIVIRGDTISLVGLSQNEFENLEKVDYRIISELINN